MKIPFSPPYIDDDIKQEVLSALDSGWITTGPKVKALEQETAAYAGVEHVLCVNSATSGLMLVLHWLGIGRGDEVIVPAYTYCATALAVMHVGATPVMVDVKDDFNIDPATVKAAITTRTKAIIAVDFAGWPCDYNALFAIVTDDTTKQVFQPVGAVQEQLGRIAVIADAAHSIGAEYENRRVGSLADLTVFSFHAVKNITTAEGGAICITLPAPFDNQQVYQTLRLWTLNGQTKDAFTKSQAGGWKYDIVYAGFKINMPDICAAIGLAQLRKYDSQLWLERKRVFETYSKAFAKYEWAELPPYEMEGARCSYHLYPIRIKNITEQQRDRVMEVIAANDVSVNVHFIPLPLLSLFKEKGYSIDDYPVTYLNYSTEISLPIYPQLTDEICSLIIETVANAYKQIVE
ncbi:DegT/DnrJ/EryC1/StrS family aminotransferase [Aridibaculum aurantiacum]|uniref:DegT/DnrJ/EryC1/StrS family aminotransferase n=1 Tax=Aridibaculum aurantiacum TaxID=2810307 RepID=UPI001A96BC9C|nr:DegT/DnrJ/EryC1/StrS family aminotransferase [Aridibaculum aurantiacum]